MDKKILTLILFILTNAKLVADTIKANTIHRSRFGVK